MDFYCGFVYKIYIVASATFLVRYNSLFLFRFHCFYPLVKFFESGQIVGKDRV